MHITLLSMAKYKDELITSTLLINKELKICIIFIPFAIRIFYIKQGTYNN